MDIFIDPVEPPKNGVMIPTTYFMYGLVQLEGLSHRVCKLHIYTIALPSP